MHTDLREKLTPFQAPEPKREGSLAYFLRSWTPFVRRYGSAAVGAKGWTSIRRGGIGASTNPLAAYIYIYIYTYII